MTLSIRKSLGLLAGEFGVPISDLTEAELNIVALRFIQADEITAVALGKLVDEVRRSERGAEGTNERGLAAAGQAPDETPMSSGPSVPKRPRYLATERTTRQRLARKHDAEDKRTALYVVPRRPEQLPAWAIHPACKAAADDGGDPCSRCLPLLHPAVCDCDPCTEWWERMDG